MDLDQRDFLQRRQVPSGGRLRICLRLAGSEHHVQHHLQGQWRIYDTNNAGDREPGAQLHLESVACAPGSPARFSAKNFCLGRLRAAISWPTGRATSRRRSCHNGLLSPLLYWLRGNIQALSKGPDCKPRVEESAARKRTLLERSASRLTRIRRQRDNFGIRLSGSLRSLGRWRGKRRRAFGAQPFERSL